MSSGKKDSSYWKENVRYILLLLFIWFIVSFGAGIIFKNMLDSINFFGFKLGFWWAHQGSIFIFVLLIFAYSLIMEKVDSHFANLMEEGEQS